MEAIKWVRSGCDPSLQSIHEELMRLPSGACGSMQTMQSTIRVAVWHLVGVPFEDAQIEAFLLMVEQVVVSTNKV